MVIGALAISGIPGLSGFFSKDEILAAAFASGHYAVWVLGLAGAAVALALLVLRPALPAPGAASAKPAEKPEKFGRVISLEPVVVNLAQTEGRRYLKAALYLEVAEDERAGKEHRQGPRTRPRPERREPRERR